MESKLGNANLEIEQQKAETQTVRAELAQAEKNLAESISTLQIQLHNELGLPNPDENFDIVHSHAGFGWHYTF